MGKTERLILIVLAGLNFTHILDFMVMMPLAPQLKRIFDMSPPEWGMVVASYTYAALVSVLVSIFFIDKVNRKKLLLFTYAGFVIATFGVGFAESYGMLIGTRILTGIFGGVINAVVLSIVTDLVPFERRGAAMGIIMTGFSAAAALGVPIGNYLGVKFGWHMPFFVTAGVGVVLFFLTMKVVPPIEPKAAKDNSLWAPWKTVGAILGDGNQVKALFYMMVVVIGHFSIVPFLSPYMVSNVGFDEIELSYIYFLGGSLTFITSPLIGKLVDRIGKQKGYVIFLTLSLIPVAFITQLGYVPMWLVLIYTTAFFILVGGRFIPATALIISVSKPEQRGVFMSVRSAVMQFSSGTAAVLAGLMVSGGEGEPLVGYDHVGYLSIALGLVTIPLVFTFKPSD